MSFTFRISFTLPDGVRLGGTESAWILADSEQERVEILPRDGSSPLKDCTDLALRGCRYPDETTAQVAAEKWLTITRAVFAANYVPADFGYREAAGFVASQAIEWMAGRVGRPVFNEARGIMIYRTEPKPVLVKIGPIHGRVERNKSRLQQGFEVARNLVIRSDDAQAVAFDLYSSAAFERSPDSKLVLYVTAVESLADRQLRPKGVEIAIEEMIASVQRIPVADNIKNSLRSSLADLRHESIGQACARLARSLGDQRYLNEPADQFFARCYALRSRLVHGALPRPELHEVRVRSGALERFVGDLISGAELRDATR